VEILCRTSGHTLRRDAVERGKRIDDLRHPRRLVALAAVWNGCQERAIRFRQQAIRGDGGQRGTKVCGPWKRGDPGRR